MGTSSAVVTVIGTGSTSETCVAEGARIGSGGGVRGAVHVQLQDNGKDRQVGRTIKDISQEVIEHGQESVQGPSHARGQMLFEGHTRQAEC